jgi:hypothetical protein
VTSPWRHLFFLPSPVSFPLYRRRHSLPHRPSPGSRPSSAGAIRAVHASSTLPCPIRRPPPRLRAAPNPSRRGESSPFRFASARRRRRRRRRGEEDPEAHRQLAAYLAKPKDRTWELEDTAKPSTATPLLPLLRAAVSFHADDLAPPRFTATSMSARGHQGEAKLPRPSVFDPAFEPRRFAIAPCRSCRRAAAGDAGLRARLVLVEIGPEGWTPTQQPPEFSPLLRSLSRGSYLYLSEERKH